VNKLVKNSLYLYIYGGVTAGQSYFLVKVADSYCTVKLFSTGFLNPVLKNFLYKVFVFMYLINKNLQSRILKRISNFLKYIIFYEEES